MDSPITFTGCLPIPSNSKNGNHTEKKKKKHKKYCIRHTGDHLKETNAILQL